MKNTLNELIEKKEKLLLKWQRALEDYQFIRFYFSGIVDEFESMVGRIVSLWDEMDSEALGPGIHQVKLMVKQQIESFRKGIPQSESFEKIKADYELLNIGYQNISKKLINELDSSEGLESKLGRIETFFDDIELEINKLYLKSKENKRFLNNLSVQLLQPIQGFLKFSDNIALSNMGLDMNEFFEEISLAAQNFTSLLNDFKLYEKITENPEQFRMSDIKFEDIIDAVLDDYTVRVSHFNIDLFYKISSDLPQYIIGNPEILKQFISLLLENAINIIQISNPLTSQDGGKISLEVVPEGDKTGRKQAIRFDIYDSGIGFPSGQLSDVFHFYSIYSEQSPFAGLKLKICQHIATYLGIELKSKSENGNNAIKARAVFDVL